MKTLVPVLANTCAALIALLGVAACGGGGGGGGGNTTYTVGGTVTGLTGSGLTIRNNSTDLAISANGAFTFPTPVPNGTGYAVTVAVQPGNPPLTCTVGNGSGTVNGSNVTNITVTCAGPLALLASAPGTGATGVPRLVAPVVDFTAKLDATTITASTVTLTGPAGNQAIAVSVENNQLTVTPTSALQPLTPYTLTVSMGVRGSAGEQLSTALTVSFVTVDHQWQTAALLQTTNASDAMTPRISFDVNGNALAIWHQRDGASYNIWWNRYTAGGGWGTAAPITSASGDGALFPQIAFDTNGNALAAWEQADGAYRSIWSSRYTAGGGWDTPVLVETDAGTALVPHLAFDAQGNALAVWYQSNGAHFNVWSNRYTAGGGWGVAELIGTADPGNWFFYDAEPQITVDAAGNALVIWQQIDGMTSRIWSNHYTAGNGWGTAGQLETSPAADPQIALDTHGNVLAVWVQGDGTTSYIWTNRYTAGSGWGTAMPVSIGGATDPQIAFDAHDNALAAWVQSDGTHTHIWSSRYTAGGGWDSPAMIEPASAADATEPQIACDTSGNAVAVWQQLHGMRNNIWSNRYTVGSGWSTAAVIETDDTGAESLPQIAIDPHGNALGVWQQTAGAQISFWWNWFESDHP